jgi:hypothetical protein
MSQKTFRFAELEEADLVVDAVYEGGDYGDVRDDPLNRLLHCGNQGGFRIRKNATGKYCLAVLYSSLNEPDWPDYLDAQTGLFVYYGDNRKPGHRLHETALHGNELLRFSFNAIHGTPPRRLDVPPFFVFTKGSKGRDVVFRGLAAPGSTIANPTEDLVAIWKSIGSERFQNYRAHFTILDVTEISRKWIDDLLDSDPLSINCPYSWRRWVETGEYHALRAEPTLRYRKRVEQLPSSERNIAIAEAVYEYFKDSPRGFERCAAEIAKLVDDNILSYDLTRPWRDGGRARR